MSMLLSQSQSSLDQFLPTSTTEEHIGPGCYDTEAKKEPRGDDSKRAPFSTSQKKFYQEASNSWREPPGPGQYEMSPGLDGGDSRQSVYAPGSPGVSARGTTHFSTSAFRARGPKTCPAIVGAGTAFTASNSLDNPGAGTYTQLREFERLPPASATGTTALFNRETNQSILSRPEDKLWHQEPVGPGTYDHDGKRYVASTTLATTEARRLFDAQSKSPGPGAYSMKSRDDFDRMPTTPVGLPFKSRTERQPYGLMNVNPGPGTYGESSGAPNSTSGADDIPSATFKSTSERSSALKGHVRSELTPGPGHYPLSKLCPAIAERGLRRTRSAASMHGTSFHAVHHPKHMQVLHERGGPATRGFHSTEERFFSLDHPASGALTGGDYYEGLQHAVGQSMQASLAKKAALSSSSSHTFGTASRGEMAVDGEAIGPGVYEQSKSATFAGSIKGGAAKNSFSSSSGRFVEEDSLSFQNSKTPDPGEYYAEKTWAPRQDFDPSTQHIFFGSCKPRWDEQSALLETADNPGPGIYEPRTAKRSTCGHARTTVRRLPSPPRGSDASGGVVGPGYYPSSNAWVHKSFNRALDKAKRQEPEPKAPSQAPTKKKLPSPLRATFPGAAAERRPLRSGVRPTATDNLLLEGVDEATESPSASLSTVFTSPSPSTVLPGRAAETNAALVEEPGVVFEAAPVAIPEAEFAAPTVGGADASPT